MIGKWTHNLKNIMTSHICLVITPRAVRFIAAIGPGVSLLLTIEAALAPVHQTRVLVLRVTLGQTAEVPLRKCTKKLHAGCYPAQNRFPDQPVS